MNVLLVYHRFTSAWQGVRSLWWSWCSLDVACACLSFACTLACFAGSSIRKKISSHASFIHPFMGKSPCMCSHCSSHSLSCHVLSMYLYMQSLMRRRHQIHKSPSLPWCMIVLDASDWERRQGFKLCAGMEALGIAGENCAKVTGIWWWSIQINNDCQWGLA